MRLLLLLLAVCLTIPASCESRNYRIESDRWVIEFDSSINLSTSISSSDLDDGTRLLTWQLMDGSGQTRAVLTLFGHPEPTETTERYLDIMLSSFIKSYNITSPSRQTIEVDGAEGLLAEGFSSERSAEWRGAIWPYMQTGGNLTIATIILYGTLGQEEFQEILETVHVRKIFVPAGPYIRADPWILVFSTPLNLSADIQRSNAAGGTNLTTIRLSDPSGGTPATFTIFSFPEPYIATDRLLYAMLDAYINGSSVENPTKRAITVDGDRGVLAEGHSSKYGRSWSGASWAFRPYYDRSMKENMTKDVMILEGTMDADQLLSGLHVTRHYDIPAGPWVVEFNSSQRLEATAEISGKGWIITLIDGVGHEVAWFFLSSFSNLLSATDDSLDKMLDSFIESYRLTSPIKSSMIVDGTEGRYAEGYSSVEQRQWRMVLYPYRPFFDSFTGTNMSRERIGFSSIQDASGFQEIAESLRVVNLADG
ncbi:MAG: hypothetical protein QUS08_09095 [Methanothrix sp.]|nr:hypothetical protein [Methanothrix sp.]